MEVLKSPNDKKLYRYMVLENGLRVLLISDPEMQITEASGAAAPEANGMELDGDGARGHEAKGKAAAAAARGQRCDGPPGGVGGTIPAGGGPSAGGKRRRESGPAASDGEESSGDLQEGEEDDEDEDEDGEGESGSEEGEGEDEEMGDGSGSGEGEEEEGEEGEEEEEEGSEGGGGRRKKGGGSSQAPVKKAAAAMAVGVGSFSDPEDLQGLSHYLEHMLFMGSAKYPAENDYDDFLTRNGGSANAFTDLELTNYHFEVAPAQLAGALDRFAQFFIAPRCAEGSMEREVLAVDSEFSQVLQDDHCRLSQIMCHTSRPGHIYRKFSWGNRASLWERPRQAGIDVRQRLLEYYQQHYGADRSCLVVLGGQPLEELGAMVAGSFGAMPGGKGPAPSFAGLEPPFQGRTLTVLPAVRDHHELRLTFALPPLARLYGTKADSYISHLMGHEGPGSLLSALKARGWATEILAGVDDDGYASNSCCSLFGVDVTLTEKGLAAGPGGCGLAVAGLVFAYVSMLRREGPQEWVWQEMRSVADQRWRFLEEGDPMDAVSRLAGAMHHTAPAHTLVADYLHESWQPDLVARLLERMAPAAAAAPGAADSTATGAGSGEPAAAAGWSPCFRIDLMTKRYDEVKASVMSMAAAEGAEVRSESEPWFGLDVLVMQLPDSLCRGWAEQPPLPELRMPPRNPYLPEDFSLRCEDPDAPEAGPAPALPPGVTSLLATPPHMLLDRPGLRLWHKLDRTFRTPRAAVHWRLYSPAGHTDPRVAATGHLCLRLLEEALREDAYLADVAGLHYHTSPEGLAGLEFRVDGFNDKLGALLGRLTGQLAGLGAEGTAGPGGAAWLAEHFEAVREALLRKYRNMNMEVGKHASYSRLYVLCSRAMHCDHILEAMETLTPQDVRPYITTLLSRCHVEAYVAGNLTAGGAVRLAEDLAAALGPGCCMPADERTRDQCVVLPAAKELAERAAAAAAAAAAKVADAGTVVRLRAKNAKEENAALEVYYQLGPATDPRDRAVLDLIDQILYEPCYDTLRTKQQLGYSVYSGTRLTAGVSSFCIQVVSARHPPEHLDACVEAFLAAQGPRLRAMTPAELATQAAAVVSAKMQRDRSLVEEAGRQWEHISSQRYDFLSRELEVAALASVTVDDVYDTFARYLMPPSAAAAGDGASDGAAGSQRRKLAVHVRPHGPMGAAKKAAAAAGAAEAETEVKESADEPTAMAVDGGAAAADGAAAATEAPEAAELMEEPAGLLALRSGLDLHPLWLGTPPAPLMAA
ncbi:hypothetical protein GPECTOR_3g355 [Gonium pectorale]|uniref:Peptidase M16 N-terminal domain-containing protein n=1 Tax=Gonium pectorale TaxID=33097 RepID=A0A150GZR7_GONPE|nr:hypothetical protein GPECTOR_3g355 [Gonium pectorale]|eukprot:KXZ55212.1 hypothetical protein GPECTOR_3g355 [Gonium pectorale]